jgi:hypothetical protein
MRTIILAIAASTLACGIAHAADQPPAQSGPQNPAVKTNSGNNSDAPVKGANSFTQGEATSRIEARGYGHVQNLQKDGNGVWRGVAMKHGHRMAVSVDFQGNVNPQ